MMKVCLVFRKKNPLFFSIEKVFAQLRPALAGSVETENIELPYYNSGLGSILKNILFLNRKRSKAVYHITGDVHYAAMVLPANRTILTIHDCVFLYANTGLKRKVLKWLFLDMPVKRAAVVTTISEFSKQEIVKYTHCAPDRIVVIPNPVNSNMYYQEKIFNSQQPVILFIGTTPNKNLERTIDALKNITCHLKILGKLTDAQTELLVKAGLFFSVVYNISEKELANLYAQADIVLFPSTFEGFGLPILEGQKAGRIVITSNIDPMKTVAGCGAFLVNPYEVQDINTGIKKMIADEQTRNKLIAKGFENICYYDAGTIANAYAALYTMLGNHAQ